MAPPQQSYTDYGPSGGELQSRTAVIADPREALVINAVGPMYSTRPGHKIGLEGSAFRYGNTDVGGTKNLIPRDGYLISMPKVPTANVLNLFTDYQNLISTFGPNNYAVPTGGSIVLNGMINTTAHETFTSAGTVTVVGTIVTGAGTAFTTATVPGYAYTPSFATPQPGDFIYISSTTHLHVIVEVTDATHLKIYPGETVAVGSAYELRRYGFPSHSRVLATGPFIGTGGIQYSTLLSNGRNGTGFSSRAGTIGAFSSSLHYTAPQNTANLDILADDIAIYKGFMVYATGGAISWSVAGFPTTVPFGALDFPAINTSVVATDDVFVSFELLGDQLVAIFEDSIWLVVPTGSIPEFNFYKLPENRGANSQGNITIGSPAIIQYSRPSCSANGAIYYINKGGIVEFTGSVGKIISDPIADKLNDFVGSALSWDPITDSVLLSQGGAPGGAAFLYSRKYGIWTRIDFSSVGSNVGSYRHLINELTLTPWSFSYVSNTGSNWNAPTGVVDSDLPATTTGVFPWTWASPILNLSDVYSRFQSGGFSIDAHGDYDASPEPTLNWTIYGGTSPYNLIAEDTGTYAYTKGTLSSRDLVGKKIDKPYVGIVLSGTKYVKLGGVSLYDTRTQARR